MIRYQFDECLNARKLIRSCNEQGMCIAIPYPKDLHGEKDWNMLPDLMTKDASLVTIDRTIVVENARHIPEQNPGMVIIVLEKRTVPMTAKIAGELLSNFKENLPNWSEQRLDNICLQISEVGVELSLVGRSKPADKSVISYDTEKFSDLFRQELERLKSKNT